MIATVFFFQKEYKTRFDIPVCRPPHMICGWWNFQSRRCAEARLQNASSLNWILHLYPDELYSICQMQKAKNYFEKMSWPLTNTKFFKQWGKGTRIAMLHSVMVSYPTLTVLQLEILFFASADICRDTHCEFEVQRGRYRHPIRHSWLIKHAN